jgi:hypothetical protein
VTVILDRAVIRKILSHIRLPSVSAKHANRYRVWAELLKRTVALRALENVDVERLRLKSLAGQE